MLILLTFIIGTYLGSFGLWLCQQWINNEPGSWTRRSRCETCQHILKAKDLIPIISFIFYKRRCAYCKTPLPFSYLWSELSAGILAVLWLFVPYGYKISYGVLFFFLFLMSWCDILEGWVPDRLQWGLFISCLWCFYPILLKDWTPWLYGILLFTSLSLILLLRPHWIGGADIKLFTILTLTLPIQWVPWLLFIPSISALIVIVGLYVWTHKWIPSIRFVPFIAISYLLLLTFAH